MKKISIDEVEHIAGLSRLRLSAEEKEKFSDQLSSILEFVSQLNEVDTEGVLPTAQVTGLSDVFSPDEILESGVTLEDIKKNSPDLSEGSFRVPGVFE
mgnify:CR=1 FL=1